MAVAGIGNSIQNNLYYNTDISQKDFKELEKNSTSDSYKYHSTENDTTSDSYKYHSTENDTTSDYYNYLQKKYESMSDGSVAVSGSFLKKCTGNSQKAKELENFIKKIPELEKQGYQQLAARNKALGGTVTYYQQSWTINGDGSIQSTVYSVTETEMTNAERMKKNMDERLEKQKEKEEKEEKETEKAQEAEKAQKIEIGFNPNRIGQTNESKLQKSIGEDEETKQARENKLQKTTEKDKVTKQSLELDNQNVTIKYVEAESKQEAQALMQKERCMQIEKTKDTYYGGIDVYV